MIPSHGGRSKTASKVADLLLVTVATPHCGWRRLLPLLKRAGCIRPSSAKMEDWLKLARDYVALGQSGVIMRQSAGTPYQTFHAATIALLGSRIHPVLVPLDDFEVKPEFWLELTEARLLMFYSRPEMPLAMAMIVGASLDVALAEWIAAAETMIDTFRTHGHRVTLIDVDSAVAAPADFLRKCKKHLRLNLRSLNATPVDGGQQQGKEPDLLLAAQMVAQSERAMNLLSQLEACSLPIRRLSSPPLINCAALYNSKRKELERKKSIEHERDHYRMLANEYARRLDDAMSELDNVKARLRTAETRISEEVSARDSIVDQLIEAEGALKSATEEGKRLIAVVESER